MKNFWQKIKKPILALAPMAGVTDSAFRQVCREQGADLVYTEMVSADGLYYQSKKTLAFLKFNRRHESPVVIQLFGKNPETFGPAARLCQKAGFSGIDLNFGCPARKVVAHGGGVTLMRDLERARQIVAATVAATTLPVSVKLRSSINKGDEKITALNFIKNLKGLPVAAVMIHGRSFEGLFDGPIDFMMIKKVKEEFPGLVLANGGIKTPRDAQKMLTKTGTDGLGLARGVYGRPWLFRQIKDYLKHGQYQELDFEEIKKVIWRHAQLAFRTKDKHGLIELRKHLAWYVSGWPGAREKRNQLVRVETLAAIRKILND